MKEGSDMQDKEVRVRWLTFDIPQLITIVTLTLSMAGTYYTMSNRIDQVRDKVGRLEENQTIVGSKVEPISNVLYRISSLEQQNTATNQRLDRFIELLTSNIELIRKDINDLTIEVRVLTQEVKSSKTNSPARN